MPLYPVQICHSSTGVLTGARQRTAGVRPVGLMLHGRGDMRSAGTTLEFPRTCCVHPFVFTPA
eukprot:scaffold10815_cov48-Phaeocystis_antarctica.AAC.2